MKPRAYLRCSTAEQAKNETTEIQLTTIRTKVEPEHVYSDEGVSGAKEMAKRPEGAKMLADARNGLFTHLYVARLDRLGRNTRHSLNLLDELQKLGISVVSVKEDMDYGTPFGEAMLTQLLLFAQLERDIIRERTQGGLVRVASAGQFMGGKVPYGWFAVPDQTDPDHWRLVPCEVRFPNPKHREWTPAKLIQAIYDLMLDDGWTCVQIAHYFDGLGLPTYWWPEHRKYGQPLYNKWTEQRVRALAIHPVHGGSYDYAVGRRLKKDENTGEIIPIKGKRISRTLPVSIVSPDRWEKAQRVLSSRRSRGKGNSKQDYLLSGLVKCAACGRNYTGASGIGRKKGRFYICMGYKNRNVRGEVCRESKWIDAGDLERDVCSKVLFYRMTPWRFIQDCREQIGQVETVIQGLRAELARIEEARAGLKRRRQGYIRLAASGDISQEDFRELRDEIDREDAALATHAKELTAEIEATERLDDSLKEVQKELLLDVPGDVDPTPAELRRWIERFIDRVTIRTTDTVSGPQFIDGTPVNEPSPKRSKRQTRAEVTWKVSINERPVTRSSTDARRRNRA